MKVVIFCGGYGTRMWPASTKSYPKQFRPIVKGKSFLRHTYERFAKAYKPEDILISTEIRYKSFIERIIPELPAGNVILEPERRDNLGAIGLVTAIIEKRYPGEVMFFSWADHFIGKVDNFLNAVNAACEYTRKYGTSVSLNEKPTFPSVHNGWIEYGKKVGEEGGFPVYEVIRQIEKPDETTAKGFMDAGNFLIHTGYASWRSDLMISYFKEFAPAVYEGLQKIMSSLGSENQEKVIKEEYSKFEKVSIDYGLYEKMPKDLRVTMATQTEWEDAGTWQLFYDAMRETDGENVIEGEVKTKFIDASGNLIIGEGEKMIAVVGLKNVAVIDTHGALLVSSLESTAKVKELFKKLEEEDPEFVD